jgi:hypothetical protein
MNSEPLDNLVKTKVLKAEPPDQTAILSRTTARSSQSVREATMADEERRASEKRSVAVLTLAEKPNP